MEYRLVYVSKKKLFYIAFRSGFSDLAVENSQNFFGK